MKHPLRFVCILAITFVLVFTLMFKYTVDNEIIHNSHESSILSSHYNFESSSTSLRDVDLDSSTSLLKDAQEKKTSSIDNQHVNMNSYAYQNAYGNANGDIVENGYATPMYIESLQSYSSNNPPTHNKTEYQAWCRDFQHLSIYTIGLKLSCIENKISFSLALMFAVFLSLLIETLLEKIEESVSNNVSAELVNKIFKELTMLGLISFGVNFLESIQFIDKLFLAFEKKGHEELNLHELTKRRVLIFELVHIILFVLSIFFVLTVVYCYRLSKSTWDQWMNIEMKDEAESLRIAFQTKKKFSQSHILLQCISIFGWVRYVNAESTIAYWAARKRFIKSNNLPSNFRYYVYLKDRSRRLMVQMAEFGYPIWLIIFLFALIYIILSIFHLDTIGDGVFSFVMIFFIGTSASCLITLILVRISYLRFLNYTSKGRNELLQEDQSLGESLIDTVAEDSQTPYIAFPDNSKDPKTNTDVQSSQIDMKRFFLARSPKLYIILMQGTLFAQCFYFSYLTLHYGYIIIATDAVSSYLILRILALLASYSTALLVFVSFPLIIAPFTILTSYGNLTSFSSISTALNHMKKWPNGKPKGVVEYHHHRHEYLDYKQSNFWVELKKVLREHHNEEQEKKD